MIALAASVASLLVSVQPPSNPRPPAVPLVTHDPYFSVWSVTDQLTDSWPRHWTGTTMGMCGMIRIDDQTFRWCGQLPGNIPAMKQTAYEVDFTSTTYRFEASGVELRVEFGSPLGLDGDLVQASQPVSYVRTSARATDGRAHEVSVYLDVSGEWTVNRPEQLVTWSRLRLDGIATVSMGSHEQPVLAKAGDHLRIDWGSLHLAAPGESGDVAIAPHASARATFARTGRIVSTDDTRMPRAASDDWPVLCAGHALGRVSAETKSAHVLLGYDDRFSIEYFERKLRPLWAARGGSLAGALAATHRVLLDRESSPATETMPPLESAAIRTGGEPFAALTKLSYRQVLAGHKIVADWDSTPLMFSKENSSNGCIATIDVIYPASPFFLYHSPEMLKAQLRPLLQYASSPRWKFPFAPHDLGTYPKANGQVYGGGETSEENQMPVEESGNMLIMLAALAKVEGTADFSRPYADLLEKWAKYLQEHGLDPANQLCTDDFAGHLARNANLSAKTVVALGAYARLLEMLDRKADAERWMGVAREFASRWMSMAADGDRTVLAFGRAGTWSQKYNLIWDRVLDLNLFPREVFEREMSLYRTKLNKFGLPLDSRETYTKLDWTVWSACLTGRREDFDAIMAPVYTWVNQGPSRVPLTDWYQTTGGEQVGFQARTVVGGIWMPLLMERMGVGLK